MADHDRLRLGVTVQYRPPVLAPDARMRSAKLHSEAGHLVDCRMADNRISKYLRRINISYDLQRNQSVLSFIFSQKIVLSQTRRRVGRRGYWRQVAMGRQDGAMTFAGKVAIITGGGTGIGAAVAKLFVAQGGKAVLLGRRRGPLEEVANALGAASVVGDAADAADMSRAVETARRQFGGLDVLVANAGGHGLGSALVTDDASWRLATRLNLDTAFVAARAALPDLVERKGSIVIVSSIAGLFAGPEVAGYVTMKHALIGLTRSLARDYGRQGVRTNALCPGWVKTAMADEQMVELARRRNLASAEEAYRLVTADVPLGRPAEPEEVASVACFLASSGEIGRASCRERV